MTTAAVNDRANYISRARAKKATAISRFLLEQPAVDLLGPEQFVRALERLDQKTRDVLARAAGQHSPSETTWGLVLEMVKIGAERRSKEVDSVTLKEAA